ncbi:SAM-dependent chlorinase/fluorinase [Actinophytocola sp.]|uniref:SAM hydrolase/SAM-dependent halogenase family protein n=1 Tax=Actinophytocola sp. TaxID=1872138 RepID=UPI002D7F3E64|nr:SAM-dependent chlorinase/fluorinase [Actinophytocola sp.]HET9142330.1 SAM-dependent chlorinase/fluorinase [Actinophytocola sp.]
MADWISFTTDYGLDDGFVAACAGVIAGIAPTVRIIHVTHLVPPQDVRRAATVLAQTVPYLPPAVHLAVVDPGVGTERRAVVIETGRGLLVGPDNGLLVPAAEALGGVRTAHQLTEPRYRLPTLSATFHGRDLFAPAAAHLATGVPPDALGPAIDPAGLIRLPTPTTVVAEGKLTTEVLSVDRFGNLQLAATAEVMPTGRVLIGDQEAVAGRTFADVPAGALVVYPDSAGQLAVAVNGGSAAALLGWSPGDVVVLRAIR